MASERPQVASATSPFPSTCTALLFADRLVCSQPTTLAGVIALPRYAAATQERKMPRDVEISDDDGD